MVRWGATLNYWWRDYLPWWSQQAILLLLQVWYVGMIGLVAYELYIEASNRAVRAGVLP